MEVLDIRHHSLDHNCPLKLRGILIWKEVAVLAYMHIVLASINVTMYVLYIVGDLKLLEAGVPNCMLCVWEMKGVMWSGSS